MIKSLKNIKMQFRSNHVAITILLLLSAVWINTAGKANAALKPDTSRKCAICHFQWVSTFFLEHRSTPIAQMPEKDHDMFSWKVCISCHDGSVRDSRSSICNDPGHRVGQIPSKRVDIPPGFPLGKNGTLKCTTCHTPHSVTEESESMAEYFLRAPNENSSFCKTCHKQKLGGLPRGNHPVDVSVKTSTDIIKQGGGKFGTDLSNQIICETCHMAHGGVNNKRLVLPLENIKSMSVLCEVCHTKNAVRPGETSAGMLSHPVDVKPENGMKIPSAWSNGEKVVVSHKEEIVCRTCHKPHHAFGKYLLSEKKGKDELCVKCHNSRTSLSEIPLNLLLQPVSESNIADNYVQETSPCSSCHLAHNGQAVFSRVRDLSRKHSDLEQFFSIPHIGLHPRMFFGSVFFEQDTGMTDRIHLFNDSGLLSDNGTIACATCHNVSQLDSYTIDGIPFDGSDNSSAGFLKPEIAERFCKACHGEEALVRFLYFHKKW